MLKKLKQSFARVEALLLSSYFGLHQEFTLSDQIQYSFSLEKAADQT